MAETFKNARLECTGSYSTIYTCPGSTTAIVMMMQAANVAGINRSVFAQYLDSSAANAATRLVDGVVIASGVALDLIAKRLVLEAGDALQVKASATSSIEVSAHILEIT